MKLWQLIVFATSFICAEAFVDIRAPEKDAAVVEALPQTQVHLVFSSHLVGHHNLQIYVSWCTLCLRKPSCKTWLKGNLTAIAVRELLRTTYALAVYPRSTLRCSRSP